MSAQSPPTSLPSSPTSPELLLPSAMHNTTNTNVSPNSNPNHGYTPKVSFDTFENPAASMFSFTLSVKSKGYATSRATRVFLCAASSDESGREALDWALEVLVQDGDELIVCRGFDQEILEKVDHDTIREEARDFMKEIQEKSVDYDPDRRLSIVLEFVPGRITDTLDRLIALYRPDSVVVGTRGRRSLKAWSNVASMGMIGMTAGAIGSVSKYCLSHSPVPVIVVRPERKVRKAVEKRKADPKRGRHFEDISTPLPSPSPAAFLSVGHSRSAATTPVSPATPLSAVQALPQLPDSLSH